MAVSPRFTAVTEADAATHVVLARRSYDHLLRTRDRALREAECERENAEHARRWASQQIAEQRRLSDRLNAVVAAAAGLGVSVQAINDALAQAGARLCSQCGERSACMVKLGTSDGWCAVCLDEAAEGETPHHEDCKHQPDGTYVCDPECPPPHGGPRCGYEAV